MRIFFTAVLLLTANLFAGRASAQIPTFPWCAEYSSGSDNRGSCGFYTLEQCKAYINGLGGFCYENQAYVAPVAPEAPAAPVAPPAQSRPMSRPR